MALISLTVVLLLVLSALYVLCNDFVVTILESLHRTASGVYYLTCSWGREVFYQPGALFACARLVLRRFSVCVCVCSSAIITCAKLRHSVTMPL